MENNNNFHIISHAISIKPFTEIYILNVHFGTIYYYIWVVVVYIGICYVNNIIEMKCTQNIHIYMKDTRHCCQSVYLYHTREYEELFPYCNMYIHNHYHNAHHIISSYLSFFFFFFTKYFHLYILYTVHQYTLYFLLTFL